MSKTREKTLCTQEVVGLWVAVLLWLVMFIVGTLVPSQPYRESFAAFEGRVSDTLLDGLLVIATYTLTNVLILCVPAGLLGALGNRAILLSDTEEAKDNNEDLTSPYCSAVLRSFLVYLAFIAGVLLLGQEPTNPTQGQYVRIAGSISLVSFAVSYRPVFFGRLLARVGRLFGGPETSSASSDAVARLAELKTSGRLSAETFTAAAQALVAGQPAKEPVSGGTSASPAA